MGTLRIHFTAADLSRTRLAPGPDPLWEIVSSLHRLQTTARHPSYPSYAGWRHRIRPALRQHGLGPLIRDRLLPIAPLRSYFPDFLTPGPVGDVDTAIAHVLATRAPGWRTWAPAAAPRCASWARRCGSTSTRPWRRTGARSAARCRASGRGAR
ncbi:hypothetical protein GCM10010168_33110 [Actinoplanes ianthinogenes]|uniref:hypothetical protein n=1 Tax=Actinoplanes ianthinogenes TaxID=122358 RepID=UPI0019BC720B|nr:hypothetical protein [Actinoplanes ianthinogenes]GGR12736.1 hypothetical protein GCM10010168_33110 [Actinoplanes ianthinogenes]